MCVGVFLIKLCKPAVRTSKQWTCLDCTDCSESWGWWRGKRLGVGIETDSRSRRFSTPVREAKRHYSERLKHHDSASVWKWLRQITNYKPRASYTTNDSRPSNDLNEFYCIFERELDCPELHLPTLEAVCIGAIRNCLHRMWLKTACINWQHRSIRDIWLHASYPLSKLGEEVSRFPVHTNSAFLRKDMSYPFWFSTLVLLSCMFYVFPCSNTPDSNEWVVI